MVLELCAILSTTAMDSDSDHAGNFFRDVLPGGYSLDDVLNTLGRFNLENLGYAGHHGTNPGYLFRGELNYECPLTSTLERTLLKRFPNGLDHRVLKQEEIKIVTDFIRNGSADPKVQGQIDAYKVEYPKNYSDDTFWFLSLMRHWGHPTRIIDFTRDIRFALFFAVEQYFGNQHNKDGDLVIYCLPCKDLHPNNSTDDNNNKMPFRFDGQHVDMNLAVGYEIGIEWMVNNNDRKKVFLEYKSRQKQSFGWDLPHNQNPRLKRQIGMFVYPFDAPDECLQKTKKSWLLQKLVFNGGHFPCCESLMPTRIRISHKLVTDLKTILEKRWGLTKESVYDLI
jgi:hypothetical protein